MWTKAENIPGAPELMNEMAVRMKVKFVNKIKTQSQKFVYIIWKGEREKRMMDSKLIA